MDLSMLEFIKLSPEEFVMLIKMTFLTTAASIIGILFLNWKTAKRLQKIEKILTKNGIKN